MNRALLDRTSGPLVLVCIVVWVKFEVHVTIMWLMSLVLVWTVHSLEGKPDESS